MAKKRTARKRSRPRASWKGELRFGLVRFTVEAVNVHSRSGSDIHFHQLHAKCGSRIQYQKVCPVHGEVSADEIVLGYEYSRNHYVEIDPDELDLLRTDEERALTIDQFIAPGELDRIYLDGRLYYLTPAAGNDREPYHLMRRAMEEMERLAIGQAVFSGKEQLACVRPHEGLLLMEMLNYAPEIRDPAAIGAGEGTRVSSQNLRLAKTLIHSLESDDFSIEDYEDRYRSRVKQLISEKRKGHEIEPPAPEEEEEPIINLMDALKRSVREKRAKTRGKRRRKAV